MLSKAPVNGLCQLSGTETPQFINFKIEYFVLSWICGTSLIIRATLKDGLKVIELHKSPIYFQISSANL